MLIIIAIAAWFRLTSASQSDDAGTPSTSLVRIEGTGDDVTVPIILPDGNYLITFSVAAWSQSTVGVFNRGTRDVEPLFSGAMSFRGQAIRAVLQPDTSRTFIVDRSGDDEASWLLTIEATYTGRWPE